MEIHDRETCWKMTFFIVNDRPLSSTIKGWSMEENMKWKFSIIDTFQSSNPH